MQMIEVRALDNGAHRNQTYNNFLPDGWAIIPEDMAVPDTFPFVEVSAEEIGGVLTVTKLTEGVMPERTEPVAPPEREPSMAEIIDTLLGVTI